MSSVPKREGDARLPLPQGPGPAFGRIVGALLSAAALACLPGEDVAPPPQPLLIAHRGASANAPEHTLAAYDRAVEAGADYIELDLQRTRDGVIVLLHDETLDRTARGPAESCTGPVREKTLAQLRSCDFGLWFTERAPEEGDRFAGEKIVTLEELLRRYDKRTRYYIETKHPEQAPRLEEELLALLEAHGLLPSAGEASRVIVQSFRPESLEKLHALRPELPLVLLLDDAWTGPAGDAELAEVAAYAVGIGPHYSDVDAELVAAAHRHGLVVHPYTVDTEAERRRLMALGVDAIFTDRVVDFAPPPRRR